MSMVNCSDQGEELKMSDHMLHARKLRPLTPQPTASSRNRMRSSILEPLYCCIPNSTFCAWSYHLTNATVKRELNVEPLVSPRWNPTPEQIQALQEMYRRGLRTPTAEQIQQIAAKLRQFGKIEGKNVFYWFQNHKARERQKWGRRQLGSPPEKDVETLDRKESEHSWKDVEVEQAKNSNCSTISEDSVSKHRAVMAESRTNGWAQFDERELQQTRQSKRVKKATPQVDLFTCQSLIYPSDTRSTSITSETSKITYSIFSNYSKLGNENRENQTLQLFPLGIANESAMRAAEKGNQMFRTNMNTNFSPKQFIEFL